MVWYDMARVVLDWWPKESQVQGNMYLIHIRVDIFTLYGFFVFCIRFTSPYMFFYRCSECELVSGYWDGVWAHGIIRKRVLIYSDVLWNIVICGIFNDNYLIFIAPVGGALQITWDGSKTYFRNMDTWNTLWIRETHYGYVEVIEVGLNDRKPILHAG